MRVFERTASTGAALEFVATPAERLTLVDLETMSEWDFGGARDVGPPRRPHARAHAVPAGVLVRLADHQPATEVYKPWRPAERKVDRLEVPRP